MAELGDAGTRLLAGRADRIAHLLEVVEASGGAERELQAAEPCRVSS